MATTTTAPTSALPDVTFNPAIHPGDLFDLEAGFRATFNFMLDAEETDKNIRDAGRNIIRNFLEELKAKDLKPRQALYDFISHTRELFDSARGQLVKVRAASAKCLMEMWAERTQIFSPAFQKVFHVLRQMGVNFPRPDMWECRCFKALATCAAPLKYAFLWPLA